MYLGTFFACKAYKDSRASQLYNQSGAQNRHNFAELQRLS